MGTKPSWSMLAKHLGLNLGEEFKVTWGPHKSPHYYKITTEGVLFRFADGRNWYFSPRVEESILFGDCDIIKLG